MNTESDIDPDQDPKKTRELLEEELTKVAGGDDDDDDDDTGTGPVGGTQVGSRDREDVGPRNV